jgi:hypothetical protein
MSTATSGWNNSSPLSTASHLSRDTLPHKDFRLKLREPKRIDIPVIVVLWAAV